MIYVVQAGKSHAHVQAGCKGSLSVGDETVVACSGFCMIGHPTVYIRFVIGEDKLVCPYCRTTFVRGNRPAAVVDARGTDIAE